MPNGIHHVTAIAGPAHRNLDFYTQALGLRLVKKTVNFDDPSTYHLYYGDEAGQPGTILTFFPWEHAAAGRVGVGETQETLFRIPQGAVGFWTHRFIERGVPHEAPVRRFGETVIAFKDPDGTRLALVAVPGIEGEPAGRRSRSRSEHAIRGLHSVSLLVAEAAPTGAILTRRARLSGDRAGKARSSAFGRMAARSAESWMCARPAVSCPDDPAAGTVHHVAFRAANDEAQADDGRETLRRTTASPRQSRRTATISARSISASRAGCCSRSPRTIRVLPWTNRRHRSANPCGYRASWSRAARKSRPFCRRMQ